GAKGGSAPQGCVPGGKEGGKDFAAGNFPAGCTVKGNFSPPLSRSKRVCPAGQRRGQRYGSNHWGGYSNPGGVAAGGAGGFGRRGGVVYPVCGAAKASGQGDLHDPPGTDADLLWGAGLPEGTEGAGLQRPCFGGSGQTGKAPQSGGPRGGGEMTGRRKKKSLAAVRVWLSAIPHLLAKVMVLYCVSCGTAACF